MYIIWVGCILTISWHEKRNQLMYRLSRFQQFGMYGCKSDSYDTETKININILILMYIYTYRTTSQLTLDVSSDLVYSTRLNLQVY